MNAFWIKVIAILAMVVDHFALYFFPDSFPLQVIGRLSYPLIAWLIANGAMHSSNIDKYLTRLAIFALLAQIPYEIGFYLTGHHVLFLNVLFTLFLGLLAIRITKFAVHPLIRALGVIACVVLAGVLNVDFGIGGVLSILAFYAYFDKPRAMVVAQVFILGFLTNLGFFVEPGYGAALAMHPMEAYAILALPLILLYNKQRGYATGYFFYWFFVVQNFAMLALKYALGPTQ